MSDNTILLELLRGIDHDSEITDAMRACKIAASTIEQLQAEVERLRHVLNEEADYCQSFADLFSNQDRERAARHQARADRLRNSAKEQANDS